MHEYIQTFYVDLKLMSCFLRGISGANRPLIVAAPAGFFAGLSSMAIYGSNSISIYTAWKTIDVRTTKYLINDIHDIMYISSDYTVNKIIKLL